MLYQPLLQDEWASNAVLHIRTRENPQVIGDGVRAAIRALNPRLPVYEVTTLSDRRAAALGQDRMMAVLAGSLGAVALLLTMIGVYGVIAYSTGRRTAEIGIRMAVGASPGSVAWMIVRETLLLVAAGLAIGIPLSLASATMLKSLLFGVAPQDPRTLTGSALLLVVAACLAGYIPAVRAAHLDPSAALRHE